MVENKNERFRSCFVKDEQLYKTKQGLTEQFSSRVISGVCSYSISLLQQCFLKSTQKLFKDLLSQIGVDYASGSDSITIGGRMHEAFNLGQLNRFPYYYELDFSGFDSS